MSGWYFQPLDWMNPARILHNIRTPIPAMATSNEGWFYQMGVVESVANHPIRIRKERGDHRTRFGQCGKTSVAAVDGCYLSMQDGFRPFIVIGNERATL